MHRMIEHENQRDNNRECGRSTTDDQGKLVESPAIAEDWNFTDCGKKSISTCTRNRQSQGRRKPRSAKGVVFLEGHTVQLFKRRVANRHDGEQLSGFGL